MKEQQQQQQQQQERTTSRPMLPTEFIASAYLRRRRKEIAFSLRRKFRRHNDKNDMMEAQESLIPLGVFDEKFTDEVQNEENKRKDDTIWCGLSLSTRLILIAAIVSLVVNMIVMFGMDLYTSSIAGALVACMVGVAQLRLEDLESKSKKSLSFDVCYVIIVDLLLLLCLFLGFPDLTLRLCFIISSLYRLLLLVGW